MGARRPRLRPVRDLYFDVFYPYAEAGPKARPGSVDSLQEARIGLQAIFEPIILRGKADQDARRFPVARDHDLLLLSLSEKAR